jgi:hypothetical protein
MVAPLSICSMKEPKAQGLVLWAEGVKDVHIRRRASARKDCRRVFFICKKASAPVVACTKEILQEVKFEALDHSSPFISGPYISRF